MMHAPVPATTIEPDRSEAALRRVPVLRGIRTGGPANEATQAEIKRAATELYPDVSRSDAMLAVFDHAEIERRSFARPIAWYRQPRTFAEKNAAYVEEALALSERLARDALADAGVAPADVDAIVFVSSTGVSTPSLDATLIGRLGISNAAVRLPLWGLGCAGGAAGLARGADLVRAGYEHVLVLAVELCSLTFVLGDDDKANFIGTALFADGGAALVLGADSPERDGGLMRVLHSHSALIDDSAGLTGWDVTTDGFKLRLSPEIPGLMVSNLRPIVDASLAEAGWAIDSLDVVVVHPGGAKVITAYEGALGLGPTMLDSARTVLRDHGNMSSPTVLFVLAEALATGASGRGLISATGPGFAAEHLLVEFPA